MALVSQQRTRQRAGSHWKKEARATFFIPCSNGLTAGLLLRQQVCQIPNVIAKPNGRAWSGQIGYRWR